jgi:AcrR family transcriptional regulator
LRLNRDNRGFYALHKELAEISGTICDSEGKRSILAAMRAIPDAVLRMLPDGIESGAFLDTEPKVLSGIVFGMISGIAMNEGIASLRDMDGDARKDLVIEIILRGIRK